MIFKLRLQVLLLVIVAWNAIVGGSYLLWGPHGYAWGGPIACALLGVGALWVWSNPKQLKGAYRADCDDETIRHIRSQLLFIALLGLGLAASSLILP